MANLFRLPRIGRVALAASLLLALAASAVWGFSGGSPGGYGAGTGGIAPPPPVPSPIPEILDPKKSPLIYPPPGSEDVQKADEERRQLEREFYRPYRPIPPAMPTPPPTVYPRPPGVR